MPLDQPASVVGPPELDEGEAEFLDGSEGPDPEQVLLQRPDEPLGVPQPQGILQSDAHVPRDAPNTFSSSGPHQGAAQPGSEREPLPDRDQNEDQERQRPEAERRNPRDEQG